MNKKGEVIFAVKSYETFKQFIGTLISLSVFVAYVVWLIANPNKNIIKHTFNYDIIEFDPHAFTTIFTLSLILCFLVIKLLKSFAFSYIDKNRDNISILKTLRDDGEYVKTMNFLKFGISIMVLIVMTVLCTFYLNFFGLVLLVWLVFGVTNLAMEATILQAASKNGMDNSKDVIFIYDRNDARYINRHKSNLEEENNAEEDEDK